MPGSKDFLRGFKIHNGLEISGYILKSIKIEHVEITRFRQYEYPMVLEFIRSPGSTTRMDLLVQLKKYVSGTRIINSRYGNPYECDFGNLTLGEITEEHLIISTTGHSHRI